jgi:hypothetical protein
MALVPVRSKHPVDGEHFITEVSEEWLDRWPEDFDRLEGDELARYELGKSGLNEVEVEIALPSVLALAAANGPADPVVPITDSTDEALDAPVVEDTTEPDPEPEPEVPSEPEAPSAPVTPPVAVDPTASSD